MEVSDTGIGMTPEIQARSSNLLHVEVHWSWSWACGCVRHRQGPQGRAQGLQRAGQGLELQVPAAGRRWRGQRALLGRTRAKGSPLVARGTILVVDDEETIRAMAARMLESLGFRVLLAGDGREALTLYAEKRAEIIGVLMDLTMPHLDGEETFRELRRIDPEVRVLLMSGYNEQDAIARFVGKGLAGFIQKPFNMEELKRSLRSTLG